MQKKVLQKAMAIRLRKAGYTYREILEKVPASKSSISVWLQDAPLTDAEKATLKKRRDDKISTGRIRAAASLRTARLDREADLHKRAEKTFQVYKHDELFRVGISLYWAEGAKRGSSFSFINSDPDMVVLMLGWMDDEALHRTLTTGRCTYWSRSRQEYWVKGETSGNRLRLTYAATDCDMG